MKHPSTIMKIAKKNIVFLPNEQIGQLWVLIKWTKH